MITFLFWNLYKQQLQESIYRIVNTHNVDVVILAECTIDPTLILYTLNSESSNFHYAPSPGCRKIKMFARFPDEFMPIRIEDERMIIRQLKTSTMVQDVLVAAIHFPSKAYWAESDQLSESPRYVDLLREAENRVGHQRTILVGDFNMNPYEKGMVNANGFNAVMSRSIAEKRERTVQGKEYSFFYNPMWGLSGDISVGPIGTYFLNPPGHSSYYWHILDQVLIRPDLLEAFESSALQILDSDGEKSLLSENGAPDKSWASDHLPLLFRFKI
jgi:endonuclease/exonuclease/phosphatase (EEP) superfamily protein YafD